jgi:hydrogenase expression/formation protein HypD
MAGRAGVYNDYASLVEKKGNPKALSLIEKYFQPCDAAWRGLGLVKDSGLVLKDKYSYLDLGSKDLIEDHKKNPLSSCDKVLLGLMEPKDCPLFGKACNPVHPQGACMVSTEGACNAYFSYQI